MRKSIVIVSLILCAAFINAQEVLNPNTPTNTTVIVNNSTLPEEPVNPNTPTNTTVIVDNSTLPAQPDNANNTTLPVNTPTNQTVIVDNSTLPTQPENPNTPNNQTVIVDNSTLPENNTTLPVVNPNTPTNQTVIVDNSTLPVNNSTLPVNNSTQETNSTIPTGVPEEDLNDFRDRDDADDWILTWNIVQEDFNKCKEDSEACCYNVGSITPIVIEQGDKQAIQFTGPATGKNCPQDGNLVITLSGLNGDDDLNPIGQEASGILLFINNMKGSNTQQTPEQRSLFVNDVQASSTLILANSTQPQNNSTIPQNNGTAILATPTENAPAAQQVPANNTDFFAILLPAHPNNNTKESSLNVLRLINEETIQTSNNGTESTVDASNSITSGKVLSACVFAVLALVISI